MRNGVEQEGTCIIDGPSLRALSWKRGEGANGPELAAATGVRGGDRGQLQCPLRHPGWAAE